eukprot:2113772-Pleurochrysis_carterae.AAC.1
MFTDKVSLESAYQLTSSNMKVKTKQAIHSINDPLALGTHESCIKARIPSCSRYFVAARPEPLGLRGGTASFKELHRSNQTRLPTPSFMAKATCQNLSNAIGSFRECVDLRSANQVLAQLEERGLVENL